MRKDKGVLLSPPDDRDYPVSAVVDMSTIEIPKDFQVWQPPVENQGSIGNCVAQSCANIMECIAHEYGEEHRDYSVGFIYGSDLNTENNGMYPRDACDVLIKQGDVLREEWECLMSNPICRNRRAQVYDSLKDKARKVNSYIRIKTKEELQAFMVKYKLPVMLIAQTSAFRAGENGRHAVVCYGWISKETWAADPDKYNDANEYGHEDLLFTNSWGTAYHNQGRGACCFEDMEEIWGIVPMEKITLTDIKGRWSEKDVQLCIDRGLVKGYEDNTFKPTQPVTREEVAVMFARYIRETDAVIKKLEEKIKELS